MKCREPLFSEEAEENFNVNPRPHCPVICKTQARYNAMLRERLFIGKICKKKLVCGPAKSV
jgi:hypothetical protein